uniref:Ig-like domain-containing protein n=1 Tax=Oreochromis aureus TaxID=47969 RepID=A0A668S6B6_OREAU
IGDFVGYILFGLQLFLHKYVYCIFSTGQVSAVTFQQSPPQLVAEKSEVQINCSHNDGNLALMLWYQHMKENQSMTLIGYGYQNTRQTFEGQFEKQFKLTRGSATTGTLTIPSAELSHSAVYFCAASTQ